MLSVKKNQREINTGKYNGIVFNKGKVKIYYIQSTK
jgi:hypothetical protein